jgi:hypothetical protein
MMDVGDYAGGVDHARTEEPAVEVITTVVVIADLFFVFGLLAGFQGEAS